MKKKSAKKNGAKRSSRPTTQRIKKKPEFSLDRFIIGTLRRASYKLWYRTKALNKAKVMYGKYQCAMCKEVFARAAIQVDHIRPVVPLTGFDSWDSYISRLFCTEEGLQILCKPCHKTKTQNENKVRKLNVKSK